MVLVKPACSSLEQELEQVRGQATNASIISTMKTMQFLGQIYLPLNNKALMET